MHPKDMSNLRECLVCGTSFTARPYALKTGNGKYCSRACAQEARRNTDPDMFWSLLDRSSDPDGCWLWTGKWKRDGYGAWKFRGKRVLTHRFAWELTHGPIPDDLCVLHDCDTRLCCNPAHLFLGTRADNNADKEAKGRAVYPLGTENGNAKLTPDDVRVIRREYAQGTVTLKQLSARFGVSISVIHDVVRRHIWRHVA